MARFEASFTNLLQSHFPPKSMERMALKRAFIVFSISSVTQRRWFHVAYCSMAQGAWRTAMLALAPDQILDCEGPIPSDLAPLKAEPESGWTLSWGAFQDSEACNQPSGRQS